MAKKEPPKPKYPTLPLREVPPWLEKSIYQYADLGGTQPYIVQGFGLVVNCDAVANSKIEPGSQRYPTAVREYILTVDPGALPRAKKSDDASDVFR